MPIKLCHKIKDKHFKKKEENAALMSKRRAEPKICEEKNWQPSPSAGKEKKYRIQ